MRLAELIGTLSLAVDAGTGLPDHHALRGATLAVGLAREVKADGLDEGKVVLVEGVVLGRAPHSVQQGRLGSRARKDP